MNFFQILPLIQTFGLIGIFAFVFAESGLFFGFFLPGDSLLFTAGILGAQYINITPGFATGNLTDQGQIQSTHSALILENLNKNC